MNILDIFKDTMQDGMEITKCKELANKYKLVLSYNGMSASCELNKLCTPGNEKSICMQAIDNAMSTMYLGKGDLKEAEVWLHGEQWNIEKSNDCKLCGTKYDFRMVQITKCLGNMGISLSGSVDQVHKENAFKFCPECGRKLTKENFDGHEIRY